MLTPAQVDEYYADLRDPAMESALALVHSRFSTNTFPSWDRSHPYRYMAHNGEINTLRGNINWMHARQAMFESELFGPDIKKIVPVINTDGVVQFIATKIAPILLAALGVIFISRAGKGEMSRVLTSSAIAIMGLAFIAGATALFLFGKNLVDLIFGSS